MKISALHIDGFGKFSGLSIEDLPPGLVVYKGANEAGKSTLFTFIRRMFFGIPNSRFCNLYPPLKGGQHGGRLVVNNSSGERCVIERNTGRKDDVKVRLPDGVEGGKAELLKLLDHADRSVFENIYAFGLEELQSFETLNDQSINSKLYCAGTGVGVSISKVLESISSRENNLYKVHGSKPRINELFREIVQTNEKIAELEGVQKKYDSLHFELEQKSRLIEQLKEKYQNVKKKSDRIHSLLSVWEDWRALQESGASLKELPELESFPEKGEEKILRLQERIKDLREDISGFQQEFEKNAIRERAIFIDEKLLGKKNEVLELGGGIEKYRSECKMLPVLEMNLKEEEAKFSELLLELGPSWDEDVLNHFDRSIPARETIIQMRRAIEEAESKIKETRSELDQILNSIERSLQENSGFDDRLLMHKDAVMELGNGIAKYRADRDFLLSGEQELQGKRTEFRETLDGLGEGWDEEALNRFDRSIPARENAIQKRKEIEESEKIIERIRDRLGAALKEIEELREEMESMEEKLKVYSSLPDYENVKQGLEAVSYLRVKYPLLREKEAELKNLEKDLEKEAMLFATFRPRETENDTKLPLWPAGMILIAGGIGLIYEYINGSLLSGVAIFLLLFATSAAYILTARRNSPVSSPLQAQKQESVSEKREVQGLKEQLSKELAALKEDMKARAKKCGFEEVPDPSVLERKADELQNAKEELRTADELRLRQDKLQKKLERLTSNYSSLEITFRADQARQKEILQEWKQWLVSLGLNPALSPENVLEIFSSIRACLEKQKTVKELEKQVRLKEVAVERYEKEAQDILKACEKPITRAGFESEIAKLREEVSVVFNQAERMKKLEVEVESLERKREELDVRLLQEEKTRNDLSERWSQWLVSRGLDPSLSVESVLEIFSVIRNCFDKQRTVKKLEEQISSSRASIKDYEAKVSGVLKECNRPVSGISSDTEVEKLRSDFELESEKLRNLEQLKTRSEELEIELRIALCKYKEAEEELSILLAAGFADTEEKFCENARIWDQRTGFKSRVYEAEQQIRRVSGDGAKYDAFVEELQNADPITLKEECQSLEECLKNLDQGISEGIDSRGAIRNQIEQLEHEDGGSLTRLMREGLQEDLREKSREWAVLVLARKILEKAIEVYEKERQPAVIVEAQAFFSTITGGRYTRIYSPLNSSKIYVEDREGRQKSVTELSRGTAEQLYLSLRFGFIREFERHSEPLPVVFDDVLVNFDPERCSSTCEAIKDLASTNQIFYFTCHPETVQMLSERFPECRVVDLDEV